MVSISGVDVKFGRILAFILVVIGLVVLYKRYGTGGGQVVEEQKAPAATEAKKESALSVESVEIVVQSKKCTFTYIKVDPETPDPTKPKFLLLHGAKFTAATWDAEVGTMAKLKEWGYQAVAVDLKPEAAIKDCAVDNKARAEAIHQLVKTLNLAKVILVSPSKSGEFSIPYIMEKEYQDEIEAFVSVAPLIPHADYTKEDFTKLDKLKVLIVQGENDKKFGADSNSYLSNIPNNKQVVIAGADHACYIDKPDVWHEELKKYLDSLKPVQS